MQVYTDPESFHIVFKTGRFIFKIPLEDCCKGPSVRGRYRIKTVRIKERMTLTRP